MQCPTTAGFPGRPGKPTRHAQMPLIPRRWHPTRWASTIPIASISACIVVGPTKVKPAFLSALESASDSGEVVGSCSVVSGAGVSAGRNDQTKLLEPASLAEGDGGPGVGAGGLDLLAVADDAGILHQRSQPGVVVRRDSLEVEAAERVPERRPLAQDDQPGQPRLERLEGEPLEHRGLALDRPPHSSSW